MTFSFLVEEVSALSGLPKTKVARVLRSFQEVTKREVQSGGTINMPLFGTFYPIQFGERSLFGGKSIVGRTKIRFKESKNMEKYGVEIDEEKVKTAGEGDRCPSCGADLTLSSFKHCCPNCGTKPFEKKPAQAEPTAVEGDDFDSRDQD